MGTEHNRVWLALFLHALLYIMQSKSVQATDCHLLVAICSVGRSPGLVLHSPRPIYLLRFAHSYPRNLEDLSSEQLRSDLLPLLPAFANPPGFAPAQAIPELEASFALATDRIQYQSGPRRTHCPEGHSRGQPSAGVSRQRTYSARRTGGTPLCPLHVSASSR